MSLLWVSTLVVYFCGLRIHGSVHPTVRRRFLILSLAVNLGLLGFFKSFDFFVDSTAALLHGFGFEASLPTLRIILPVGISFYTFQPLSYTIDI